MKIDPVRSRACAWLLLNCHAAIRSCQRQIFNVCKSMNMDQNMNYFEQRGSLKTGDILKDHKRRHNEYQNADGLLVKEICESEALFYGKKGNVFSEPFSVPSMLKYPWLRHRE